MKTIGSIFIKNKNELNELTKVMEETGGYMWMSKHKPTDYSTFGPPAYPFYIQINLCFGNQKRLTFSKFHYNINGVPVYDAFKYIDILKGETNEA